MPFSDVPNSMDDCTWLLEKLRSQNPENPRLTRTHFLASLEFLGLPYDGTLSDGHLYQLSTAARAYANERELLYDAPDLAVAPAIFFPSKLATDSWEGYIAKLQHETHRLKLKASGIYDGDETFDEIEWHTSVQEAYQLMLFLRESRIASFEDLLAVEETEMHHIQADQAIERWNELALPDRLPQEDARAYHQRIVEELRMQAPSIYDTLMTQPRLPSHTTRPSSSPPSAHDS